VLARPGHFQFDYFQPARARHALGNLPDPIQIKSMFSAICARAPRHAIPDDRPTKKWASPTGVLRQSWHCDTTVFFAGITPPIWKHKPGGVRQWKKGRFSSR